MGPDSVRKCTNITICIFSKRSSYVLTDQIVPEISLRSNPSATTPKFVLSFTDFKIGVTVKDGSGVIALGDILIELSKSNGFEGKVRRLSVVSCVALTTSNADLEFNLGLLLANNVCVLSQTVPYLISLLVVAAMP